MLHADCDLILIMESSSGVRRAYTNAAEHCIVGRAAAKAGRLKQALQLPSEPSAPLLPWPGHG